MKPFCLAALALVSAVPVLNQVNNQLLSRASGALVVY